MQEVVHQNKDNKWYFWDEDWAFEEGPFDTKEEAEEALKKYCKEYLGLEERNV